MKYYVTCNERELVIRSGNIWSACMAALRIWEPKSLDWIDESDLGYAFIVSQKGFRDEETMDADDHLITLEQIMKILLRARTPDKFLAPFKLGP